jgi:hypothetical protein
MSIAPLLLTGGGMVLNLLVLPTLLNDEAAVPRLQSVPSVGALTAMTAGYVMLGHPLPAIATALGAILWGLVAVYRNP